MNSDFTDGISSEVMESLKLPPEFDEATYDTALNLDTFLKQPEQPVAALSAKIEAYREASLSHLSRLNRKQAFDIKSPSLLSSLFIRFLGESIPFLGLRRSSLYLPQDAKPSDYGANPSLFPDDRRYFSDWTFPMNSGNKASRQDGNLFCFCQLDNRNVKKLQSSESGVGILYKPSRTLSVIELRPQVEWSGNFASLVNLQGIGGGSVYVNAELLLVMWQQIPGGFDLLSFKRFEIGTSGRRDASFRAGVEPFPKSDSSDLSALFQVQSGRTYLLGVVSRVSVISELFLSNSGSLPPSPEQLSVYGAMTSKVPKINVSIKQVNIL
jgi:hypothetical protein